MFAVMSAYPSIPGSTITDHWPAAQVMAGLSAVPMGHAIDLAQIFPAPERARHDALIVETRRHLGGCMTAIEMNLRLLLEQDRGAEAMLAPHPDPLCWPMIRAHPSLISPALLDHMQMRAGVSVMLRQYGRADSDRPESIEPGDLLPRDDPAVSDAASLLALAEGRWLATGAEDQPLRPDLPAEYFVECVWIAVACLAAMVERSARTDGGVIMATIERAGSDLLARHDEATGPIAAADRLVRLLDGCGDQPDYLDRVLAQRRFLLFAALAGRRARLATASIVDLLLVGDVEQIAALYRTLGGSVADYQRLLLSLRPVRPTLTDAVVVAQAGYYGALDQAQAEGTVRLLRAPLALRLKLDHLRQATGR